MITEEQAEKANDFIRDHAAKFGEAKGHRIYLEQYRKTKKAMLIQEASGTIQERDAYAYSHDSYVEVLEGLRAAVEQEETLRWQMEAAKAKIEIWRSENAARRGGA